MGQDNLRLQYWTRQPQTKIQDNMRPDIMKQYNVSQYDLRQKWDNTRQYNLRLTIWDKKYTVYHTRQVQSQNTTWDETIWDNTIS